MTHEANYDIALGLLLDPPVVAWSSWQCPYIGGRFDLEPSAESDEVLTRAEIKTITLTNVFTSIGPEEASDLKTYAVFPLAATKLDDIYNTIKRFAHDQAVHMEPNPDVLDLGPVLYWDFKATASNAQKLEEALGSDAFLVDDRPANVDPEPESQVSLLAPSTEDERNARNNLTLRPGTFSFRDDKAPDDLKVVSWPPNVDFNAVTSYIYDDQWRKDPTVYLIDSGVDPDNVDFQLQSRIVDWAYSPLVRRYGEATETDGSRRGHGSCVASKAIGSKNGVYRRSKLKVLKIRPDSPFQDIPWAFGEVAADITRSGRNIPAVVIYPLISYPNPDYMKWTSVKVRMEHIFNQGGSIIVPSGNAGPGPVDGLPAMYAADPEFPLIVVGSVSNAGDEMRFSQRAPYVTTWAPGLEVSCASLARSRKANGTSFSTGMVGGLVAWALATNRVTFESSYEFARGLKNWIANRACLKRSRTGPPVIWNENQYLEAVTS